MENRVHSAEGVELVALPPTPVIAQSKGSAGAGVGLALLIFAAFIVIWGVNTLVQICAPNKILIISGRKYRRPDGHELGYRVIYGGRTFTENGKLKNSRNREAIGRRAVRHIPATVEGLTDDIGRDAQADRAETDAGTVIGKCDRPAGKRAARGN